MVINCTEPGLMKKLLFPALLLLLFLLALWGHLALERATNPQTALATQAGAPKRIVSLAPSLTETLFALGLGPQVAGVTQFCAYPPEAALKPKVAGFSDIYLEALVRTRPDLVVLPLDKTWNRLQMDRLGLPSLTLDTRSLAGLLQSIELLGQITVPGDTHGTEAKVLLEHIKQGMATAQARATGRKRPRVLFSVMHSYQGLGYISEISVIGNDGFYNELIKIAGGQNAYQGSLPFPRLSREAIIFLNPEVIIDVIPPGENLEAVRRDWQSLGSVSAIKNKRLVLLSDEAHTVPGPRFVQTLEGLSQAFHPAPVAVPANVPLSPPASLLPPGVNLGPTPGNIPLASPNGSAFSSNLTGSSGFPSPSGPSGPAQTKKAQP